MKNYMKEFIIDNSPLEIETLYNVIDNELILKLSTESFSILIQKDITLSKITEIIESNFSYPYSAIIGSKIDSRQFNSIPERTFDVKLKKIKVPSNYYPCDELNKKKDKLNSQIKDIIAPKIKILSHNSVKILACI